MADPVLLSDCKVYLGGYDITGSINSVKLEAKRAELGNSRMGDDAETFYPGLMQVDAGVSGFYEAGSGLVDTVIASPRIISSSYDASEWPLTFAPPSAPGLAGADGNVCYNVRSAQFGYQIGSAHGGLLPYDLTSRVRTGTMDRGTIMMAKATRTATYTGTARQLGAVTASQQLVAILHVFSVTGGSGSVTVTVESDNLVGFATPTTRATFTAVATAAGVGRQVVVTAGAITDDWWRVVATWTAGTNYSAACALAITPI